MMTSDFNQPQEAPRAPARPAEILQIRSQLWTESRAVLDQFIAETFVQGVDFGTILVKGKPTKPTLFKPGAEKVCALYGWTARFARDQASYEMLGSPPGLVCYICRLIDTAGNTVGEGRGAAKLGEGTDHTANQVVKKAQKRAKVDAVLSAAQLSEKFTQDLEDEPQTTNADPAPEPTNWAGDRNEREALAAGIEQYRVRLGWTPQRFGEFCRKEYQALGAQMSMDQVRALHARMQNAVNRLEARGD